MKPKLHTFLLGSSLLLAVSAVNAQTWDGSSSGSWNTGSNWSTDSVPGDNAAITFYETGALNLNTNTDARFTLDSITFNSTATSPVTINTTASPTTFDSGTGIRFNAGTNISVAAGAHEIVGTGVNSGAAYDVIFNGAAGSSHTFDIASGASFEIQGRIHHGSSNNKDYIKTGGGTLILSSPNGGSSSWTIASTRSFQIQQGATRFAATNATGNSANNYTVSSGAAFELVGGFAQNLSNSSITLNGTGIGENGALRNISGNNTITAVNTATGNIVLNSASSIGVDAGSLTLKKVISGTGSLSKVGAGTLVLSDTYSNNTSTLANTYTGSTTISAGTLEVQGSIASSSGITNHASLVFNSAAAQSYGNAIGGTGTLTKQGAGTLTLSANNSYAGNTTISAGILQIGGGGTSGTLGNHSNTFIASGAELRINRSTDSFGYTYTGELSGSGTVNILEARRYNFQNNNQTASGSLSFVVDGVIGINSGSGVTAVHLGELSGSGTIQRAGSAPSNSPLTVLTIGGKNTSSEFSGNITNIAEFAIEKTGSGTLTLAGSNGHGGGTTVSAGTLYVTGALTNSAVIVQANGTIGSNGINGTLGNGLTIDAGGNLDLTGASLGLNSTGILNLTGGSLTLNNLTFQDLVGWTWANADAGTYKLIDGTFSIDWGSTEFLSAATAYDFGNGKKGYFESGSLNVVVIPEPGTALLGGLGLLALLRRRRRDPAFS